MTDPNHVPVQIPYHWKSEQPQRPTVARRIAEKAYEEYAHPYGVNETFDWINERGGFGAEEIMMLLMARIERLEDKQ